MMKNATLKCLKFGFVAFLLSFSFARACNLSDLSLVSVTGTGPYILTVRLCVGMGLTGSTKGGDQSTNSLLFGFWDDTLGLNVNAFLPQNLVGPMGCSMPGSILGPDPYLGVQEQVAYIDPNYISPNALCDRSPYGCVNSTLDCGLARSYCTNLSFTVNQIPDSMRVFGVEGGGNPLGGCYPNADMLIIFVPTAVTWGDITALPSAAGIQLRWSTLSEKNSDFIMVERSVDGETFTEIGRLATAVNSSGPVDYEFFDASPGAGQNHYRLVQVDKTGMSDDSPVIQSFYASPTKLGWGAVGPIPASNYVDVSFYCPAFDHVQFQLLDLNGRNTAAFEIDAAIGGNVMRLDLGKVRAGTYYLKMIGSTGSLVKKIVKL